MWNWSGDSDTKMHKENLSAVQVPVPGLGLSTEEALDVAVRCMLCVCVCVCLCADSQLYTPGYQESSESSIRIKIGNNLNKRKKIRKQKRSLQDLFKITSHLYSELNS